MTREFIIRAEGHPSDAIDAPTDLIEWGVDEPIDSPHWHWYAIWVENGFHSGRLAHGKPLPRAGSGEHRPDECVNFIAYRAWLIANCPGGRFVANRKTVGSYEWIKIVFENHIEATDHMVTWEGSGPVSD